MKEKTMRRLMVVVVGTLGLLTWGCGGDTPTAPPPVPTPPPVTRAAMAIVVTPSPILATQSGVADFPNRMDYSVTINETAGLGLNVNRIVRSYRSSPGGTDFATGTTNPTELTTRAGTNHINAKGSLNVGAFQLTYSGPRQIILTVSVEAIDDKGNTITATTGDINIL